MRDVATIVRNLAAGKPVTLIGGTLEGELRLPLDVRAPLTLRDVTLLKPIIGSSTSFGRLVDLRGSRLKAGADFSGATFDGPALFAGLHAEGKHHVRFDLATFRGSALFGGATFDGPTTFAASEFGGASHFRGVHFNAPADFDSSSFRDSADFSGSTFTAAARFNAVGFRSVADFSGGDFSGKAMFAATRFSQRADFIGTIFGDANNAPASFRGARFDAGASFLDAEFDGSATFDLAEAANDMVFDGAEFDARASFSTVRFLGDTSFSQADLFGFTNFDQAVLQKLDLDGAVFEQAARLALPKAGGTTGHVDELRLDPSDINRIGSGAGSRREREHALKLIEAAARRGGDVSAANTAYLRLRILRRHDRSAVPRFLDWLGLWLIAGYLVLPWHQVIILPLLLVLGGALRKLRARRGKAKPVSWRNAFVRSFLSFWRLKIHEGTAWSAAEALLYKAVIVLLILSLANVVPSVRDLVKGVLF